MPVLSCGPLHSLNVRSFVRLVQRRGVSGEVGGDRDPRRWGRGRLDLTLQCHHQHGSAYRETRRTLSPPVALHIGGLDVTLHCHHQHGSAYRETRCNSLPQSVSTHLIFCLNGAATLCPHYPISFLFVL